MSDIVSKNIGVVSSDLENLYLVARAYVNDSWSKNTQRSYAYLWKRYQDWCEEKRMSSMPTSVECISLYISQLAQEGKSFSTIDMTIACVELAHKVSGAEILGNRELYNMTRKGIRRTHKEKLKIKQAKPISLLDLKIACKNFDTSTKDHRNKAVVTLLFFSAMRRCELVSLDREHVEFTEKGMKILLFGSKTNDSLEEIYVTRSKDIDVCPVCALYEWITISNTYSGPIFRGLIKGGYISEKRLSGHAISVIMKDVFGKDYSGHSTRRGVITELSEKGVPIHKIQKVSRHKSSDMILRYAEAAKGYDSSAITILNL